MNRSSTSSSRNGRLARRTVGAAAVGLVLLVAGSSAGASNPCFGVRGHYDEHVVVEGCESEVQFCIAGPYSGSIKGDFFASATSFLPTRDTGVTGVTAFTADTVVEAKIRGREGQLMIKNAGVFQTSGKGNIVDLQTIVGGTGELEGATGAIRASGLFSPTTGTGSSDYEGEVCLPHA